jgi:hypothetical protein
MAAKAHKLSSDVAITLVIHESEGCNQAQYDGFHQLNTSQELLIAVNACALAVTSTRPVQAISQSATHDHRVYILQSFLNHANAALFEKILTNQVHVGGTHTYAHHDVIVQSNFNAANERPDEYIFLYQLSVGHQVHHEVGSQYVDTVQHSSSFNIAYASSELAISKNQSLFGVSIQLDGAQ